MRTIIYHYPSKNEILFREEFDFSVGYFFLFCHDHGLMPEKNRKGFQAEGQDYRIVVEFEDFKEMYINWDKYKSFLC